MKLSELTYEYLLSARVYIPHMHTDASDAMRSILSKHHFEKAKAELMAGYGDVNLIITPSAPWYDRIRIDDAKWQADYEDFCRRKAEFCKKYGSE